MEKLNECPVCNTPNKRGFLSVKDYTVSGERFTLQQCVSCSFVFTNPRPDINKIGAYYQSENYISHSDTNKGLINKLYKIIRSYSLGSKINLIKEYAKNGELLDIGCGAGFFLKKAKELGYNITGIEPDDKTRFAASNNTGIEIFADDNKIEAKKYNVITMWHVLEHVHSLKERVVSLKNKLSDNGIIVIAVPNAEAYDANYYKEYWAAYDVPRHLYHFKKSDIKNLFQQENMEVISIKPMWFDSYYIAMLSEKYKNGKGNILKAFFIGMISNLKSKSGTNTSSLIYIIRKK